MVLSGHDGALAAHARDSLLLILAPREITHRGGGPPDRIYSEATGTGAFSGNGSLKNGAFSCKGSIAEPILMTGCVGNQLRQLVRTTDTIYIIEIFPALASRRQLIVTFIERDTARSSPTQGTAKKDLA